MSSVISALTIPKLGLTMKEGTVAKWHVDVGAEVSVGTPLFDVETEKVTQECEAEVAGTLRRQLVVQGTVMPVGALIGVVAPADVAESDIDRFIAEFKPEQQV